MTKGQKLINDSTEIDEIFILNVQKSIKENISKFIDLKYELEKSADQPADIAIINIELEYVENELQRNRDILAICMENKRLKKELKEKDDAEKELKIPKKQTERQRYEP